jgi:phosphoglycolate phosphatase-like HAD superfamily hydrolase
MVPILSDTRCVVFDFDGTLVISNTIKHASLYSTVCDIPGADRCLNDILARPSHGDRTEIFRALDQLLRDRGLFLGGDPQRWVRDYAETCEREIIRAPEVPGAVRLLETLLERRITCYVNSSTPTAALERIVAGRVWTRYFDKCLGWTGDKARNLGTIARGKYAAKEILMVGDSQDDLDAAVAFGCKFVGVGRDTSRFLSVPETMVPDLHALTDRLFTSSQS